MIKRTAFFVIGFIVLTIGPIIGLISLNKSPEPPAAAPAAEEHDETNSDGHHNNDSEEMGDVVDLTDQSEVSMDIKDFKYEMPNIKIKKGTTVTWTNQDLMEHNVMQDHGDSGAAHDAPSKDDIQDDVFAGPLLAKGESYSFTFNEVESGPYHCSPHPYMKGSVTVVE